MQGKAPSAPDPPSLGNPLPLSMPWFIPLGNGPLPKLRKSMLFPESLEQNAVTPVSITTILILPSSQITPLLRVGSCWNFQTPLEIPDTWIHQYKLLNQLPTWLESDSAVRTAPKFMLWRDRCIFCLAPPPPSPDGPSQKLLLNPTTSAPPMLPQHFLLSLLASNIKLFLVYLHMSEAAKSQSYQLTEEIEMQNRKGASCSKVGKAVLLCLADSLFTCHCSSYLLLNVTLSPLGHRDPQR